MKQHRPRRPNPFMAYQPRGAVIPPYFYSPYGYGYAFLTIAITCNNLFLLCDVIKILTSMEIGTFFLLLQESSKVQNVNALQSLLLKPQLLL